MSRAWLDMMRYGEVELEGTDCGHLIFHVEYEGKEYVVECIPDNVFVADYNGDDPREYDPYTMKPMNEEDEEEE